MTRFLDGPAAGVALLLRRAPLFLRVVRTAEGKWDALDQLTDVPAAGEALHVYRRAGPRGSLHIDTVEKRRRVGRWYQTGDYTFVAAQPADAVVRDTASWRQWAAERYAAER